MTHPDNRALAHNVALITGAGSGLGAAMAKAFAAEGAKVILADLNLESAQEQAGLIRAFGGKAAAVEMNVADESQVDAAFRFAAETFGPVTLAVANAGIQLIKPFQELSYEDWQRVMRINLDGAFLTSRAAYREMLRSGHGGGILFIGSVHSKEASVLKAPYVTAKHGVIGLSKVIAKEGAPYKIRSNVICPGFVRTPLVERQIPEQARELGLTEDQVIKKVMLKDTIDGEFTTVDEIARAAIFLASFKTGGLSGQSLVVSHGWHLA